MSDETPIIPPSKQEIAATLGDIRVSLAGVLLELHSKQKRDFQTSDFVIEEFRRLVRSVDRLTDVLERSQ